MCRDSLVLFIISGTSASDRSGDNSGLLVTDSRADLTGTDDDAAADYLYITEDHFSTDSCQPHRSQVDSLTEEVCEKLNISNHHHSDSKTAPLLRKSDKQNNSQSHRTVSGLTRQVDVGDTPAASVSGLADSLERGERDEGIGMMELPTTDENDEYSVSLYAIH